MKAFKKAIVAMVLFCILSCVPFVTAFAANEPGNVTKLSGSQYTENSVKLKWNRASKATGYHVYLVDSKTGKTTLVASVRSTSTVIKNLKPEQKYSFQVKAYRTVKKVQYESLKASPVAKVSVVVKTPATPTGLRVHTLINKGVNLAWNKAKNATGYQVYILKPGAKEYKLISTVSKNICTIKKLYAKANYKFKVKAIRSAYGVTKESGFSGETSVTIREYSSLTNTVHGKMYNVRFKSTVNVKRNDTNETIKVTAGTTGRAYSKSGNVTVLLGNGVPVTVASRYLSYQSFSVTLTPYSQEVKEAFINDKGYRSNTSTLIWLSQYTCNVSIFRGSQYNWKLIRSAPCIIGRMATPTPVGTFRLIKRLYMYGGPALFFTFNNSTGAGNGFHNRVDGNTHGVYSHGCVRLGYSDLMFLANNCPLGTTVVSY